MSLPDFDSKGDLPEGIHQATIDEVVTRFGIGNGQRQNVAARLTHIYNLVRATGKLGRFIIFGSFITDKLAPNDVDIVLVMRDDFLLSACDEETATVFDHAQAEARFGASVFWIRPTLLILETPDEFIAHWQVKRDHTRRGIVEVLA